MQTDETRRRRRGFFAHPTAAQHSMTEQTPTASQDTQGHVLLVEDDLEQTQVLECFLKDHRCKVTSRANGVEALQEVMNTEFDAVVCDMVMPMMPGDMFYLAVRRVRPVQCARFVFVTAHSETPRTRDFLSQVSGTVIRKPFHLEDLWAALEPLLQARQAERQADVQPTGNG